jgi:small subunit ribosomal protein S11
MAEEKDKTEDKPLKEEPTAAEDVKKESAEEKKPASDVKEQAEPAKKDSAKAEPAKDESAKAEPAKKESAKAEPAKAEPAKAEPAKAEPAKKESAKAEPAKKESAKAEPAKKDSAAATEGASPVAETAADILATDEPAPIKAAPKGKKSRVVPVGIAHVRSTFNNTMVSITDTHGAVISWSSAGKAGFKGSRKSTAFAATLVAQDAARQAMSRGMREVEVRIQGAGAGRESAVRALQSVGLTISVIKDVTPVPHNGCRPKKRRRV